MNEKKIVELTRDLIKACGGLEEAARHCRYSVPQLSRCQTEGSGCFLALDVAIALEVYCKTPVISRAMIAEVPDVRPPADLREETGEFIEAAADVHRVVRLADRDGKRSSRERKVIRQKLAIARDELRDVEAALDAEDAA